MKCWCISSFLWRRSCGSSFEMGRAKCNYENTCDYASEWEESRRRLGSWYVRRVEANIMTLELIRSGVMSPEECLCRRSNLHATLTSPVAGNAAASNYPIPPTAGIYSENVGEFVLFTLPVWRFWLEVVVVFRSGPERYDTWTEYKGACPLPNQDHIITLCSSAHHFSMSRQTSKIRQLRQKVLLQTGKRTYERKDTECAKNCCVLEAHPTLHWNIRSRFWFQKPNGRSCFHVARCTTQRSGICRPLPRCCVCIWSSGRHCSGQPKFYVQDFFRFESTQSKTKQQLVTTSTTLNFTFQLQPSLSCLNHTSERCWTDKL